MVKADPKHDYYADLELPSTADSETIKKQFRLLAKQYHPDRNPGREIEVVPKFQAVQAANEILSDPNQKKKYDADRANLTAGDSPASHAFKKPAKPPPPPPSQFPPPPKRSPVPPQGYFRPSNPRPAASSGTAEKFAQFTRAGPQQWDRAKFDATRDEKLRSFTNLRSSSREPPRPPPRPPTAAKPSGTGPSPDLPPHATSQASAPFPGLSRTNSGRKGFAPGAPGSDEPPAPPSAYAYVHRSQPPPANYPYPQHAPAAGASTSPPTSRPHKSMEPLRTNGDAQRPAFSRSSSRYAGTGGEKTDIHSPGIARSASVRNSPVERRWDDSGPFGNRPQSQSQSGFKAPPPRPRSSSPRGRAGNAQFTFPDSESTSEDDQSRNTDRPKATPRKARPPPRNTARTAPENDPALTGQFPKKNYTKLMEENQYHYPPPNSNDTPYRRPFSNLQTPIDDITQGMNNAGIRHVHRDDVPLKKYDPSPASFSCPKPWINPQDGKPYHTRGSMIRGVPCWALPSTVFPEKAPKDARVNLPYGRGHSIKSPREKQASPNLFRNLMTRCSNELSSSNSQRADGNSSEPQSNTANPNATFSAADWDGKFATADNIFRPTESTSRSKSPSKQPRPKLSHRGRGAPQSQDGNDESSSNDDVGPKMAGVRHVPGTSNEQSKAAAFQAGRFSAENWAEKLRSKSDDSVRKVSPRPKPPKGSATTPNFHDEVHVEEDSSPSPVHTHQHQHNVEPDAMDIDDTMPQTTSSASNAHTSAATANRRPSSGGVALGELAEAAPFKPSVTGLADLGDINDSLPFKSRAADELNLHQVPSSGQAARHLHLPPPPKTVVAPDDLHLEQESWSKYSEKMVRYMHDWNVFNCKMIDHFRIRQEQITLAMYHNWVTAVGDGASADDFDGLDFVGDLHSDHDQVNGHGGKHSKPKKAGYATYMQWLEQDQVCRSWWEVAVEEHRACMEELGRVRKRVKSIREREPGT